MGPGSILLTNQKAEMFLKINIRQGLDFIKTSKPIAPVDGCDQNTFEDIHIICTWEVRPIPLEMMTIA